MPPQKRIVVPKPVQKPIKMFAGGGIIPPKFTPSLYEWLFLNAEQIIKNEFQGGASGIKTLYVVPANCTLFINSAWIEGECSGLGAGIGVYALLYPTLDSPFRSFLTLSFWDDDLTSNSNSQNFQNPLKIPTGTSIKLETDSGHLIVSGGFTGFLVKNHNLPQI